MAMMISRYGWFSFASIFALTGHAATPSMVIVDTGQVLTYNTTKPIGAPTANQPFYGQDAQYAGPQPAYRDNGDGTVTDLNTGLMWSRAVDAKKLTLSEAEGSAKKLNLGGHHDWRLPNIKELYSLIDFRGATGMAPPEATSAPASAVPYINTDYFDFRFGGTVEGDRYIDAQWLTTTRYVSTTMNGAPTLFGVNFADGRIKGYGFKRRDGREKSFYVRYVRGAEYGTNDFVDHGDGTVTDRATGLTWMQADSGKGLTWEEALRYAEEMKLAGHDDWRLPNAKELQAIVDYSRSPDTTDSPAIAAVFQTTSIKNEEGKKDWPFFWTSTTHLDGPDASQAIYVCFGRAIGEMRDRVMDVHGAGAQRSDPKTGVARLGHGPQGDAQRILNYVRCVRGGTVTATAPTAPQADQYPATIRVDGEAYQPEALPYTKMKSRSLGRENGQDSAGPMPRRKN